MVREVPLWCGRVLGDPAQPFAPNGLTRQGVRNGQQQELQLLPLPTITSTRWLQPMGHGERSSPGCTSGPGVAVRIASRMSSSSTSMQREKSCGLSAGFQYAPIIQTKEKFRSLPMAREGRYLPGAMIGQDIGVMRSLRRESMGQGNTFGTRKGSRFHLEASTFTNHASQAMEPVARGFPAGRSSQMPCIP